MMTQPMTRSAAPWLLPLSIAFACGCATEADLLSDAPPPEAVLAELSATEADLLCSPYQGDYLGEDLQHAYCLANRYGATACEEGYRACMEEGLSASCEGFSCLHPAIALGPDPSPLCAPALLGACAATAAQWRACVEDAERGLLETFGDASCADAEDEDEPFTVGRAALMPASCEALVERCPGLVAHESPIECEFEVQTRGALELHVSTRGGGCGVTLPAAETGDRRVGLTSSPPGEDGPLRRLTVLTEQIAADTSLEQHTVGVSVIAGPVLWSSADGCTVDVDTEQCIVGLSGRSFAGVRYHFSNGTCDAPLTPTLDAAGEEPGEDVGSLEVVAFSGMTDCRRQ